MATPARDANHRNYGQAYPSDSLNKSRFYEVQNVGLRYGGMAVSTRDHRKVTPVSYAVKRK
jgi:hypothetical protein